MKPSFLQVTATLRAAAADSPADAPVPPPPRLGLPDPAELGGPAPARDAHRVRAGLVPAVAAGGLTPAAPAHAAHVQLLGPTAERVAAAVGPARRADPAGGRAQEAALPPGGHLPRGAGHAGDAAVSGRDEPAEDLRGDPGDVPQDVDWVE